MSQITWAYTPSNDVAVYLDGRRVGTIIRLTLHSYAYVPNGQKRENHGRPFDSIADCLKSLVDHDSDWTV